MHTLGPIHIFDNILDLFDFQPSMIKLTAPVPHANSALFPTCIEIYGNSTSLYTTNVLINYVEINVGGSKRAL